ncbi:hypothetical protein L7F22_065164 [Adiantum nelumboides]|nr:hypothetical protein [Adiantum nelumboides]
MFWRIYKRRSTENFKGLPYICTLLSTSLWTYYSLIKPKSTLILTINAAGTVLQSFYLTVFLIFVPKQCKVINMHDVDLIEARKASTRSISSSKLKSNTVWNDLGEQSNLTSVCTKHT